MDEKSMISKSTSLQADIGKRIKEEIKSQIKTALITPKPQTRTTSTIQKKVIPSNTIPIEGEYIIIGGAIPIPITYTSQPQQKIIQQTITVTKKSNDALLASAGKKIAEKIIPKPQIRTTSTILKPKPETLTSQPSGALLASAGKKIAEKIVSQTKITPSKPKKIKFSVSPPMRTTVKERVKSSLQSKAIAKRKSIFRV